VAVPPPRDPSTDPSLERICGVGSSPKSKGKKSRRSSPTRSTSVQSREFEARRRRSACRDGRRLSGAIPHAFFLRHAQGDRLKLTDARRTTRSAHFHVRRKRAWRKVIQRIIAGPDQGRRNWCSRLARRADRQFLARAKTVKPTEPANMQVFIGRVRSHQERDECSKRRPLHPCASRFRRDRPEPRPAARRLLSGFDVVPHFIYKACSLPTSSPNTIRSERARFSRERWRGASAVFDQTPSPGWSLAHPSRMIAHNRRAQHAAAATSTGCAAHGRLGAFETVRQGHKTPRLWTSPMEGSPTPPASTTPRSWCRAAPRCRTP